MKIGLIGNQNSGKTTLFNKLTGMNSKVGNWAGVTIEKKIGKIKGTNDEIIDLPGIYSLSPYSTEEDISKSFIFNEKPDVIINIIDATSLERSLYLTTQLIELDCRVIIALNMTDILEKKGISIDIEKLERRLGVKILKISALKSTGIEELIEELSQKEYIQKIHIYDSKIENAIMGIENILDQKIEHKRFVAIKLLEEDESFNKYRVNKMQNIINKVCSLYDTDMEEIIAEKRYAFIREVKRRKYK